MIKLTWRLLVLAALVWAGAVSAQITGDSPMVPNYSGLGGTGSGVSSVATSCPDSGAASGAVTISGSLAPNAQTGTTYTFNGTGTSGTGATADCGVLTTFNNASPVAVTLPQAGTTGFATGVYFAVQNKGAGTVTITPTTSTINGATTLTLAANVGYTIISDGTNYQIFGSAPSGGGGTPANPTATAGPTAVNGSATTFMRSDAAPAVQTATTGQFGLVKPDGTSVTISAGVISASPVSSGVASVGNAASDATLTIAGSGTGPYTGSVTAALNLSHANTWSAAQTMPAGSVSAPGLVVGNSTTGIYSASTTGVGAAVNGTLVYDYGITHSASTSFSSGNVYLTGSASSLLVSNNAGTLQLGSAADAIIGRNAAASIRFGASDGAAPVAQTIGVQSATGTNTSGVNWTINGSRSTGSGTSGDVIIQTGGTGAASTTQNASVTALTIKGATQQINASGVINPNTGFTPTAGSGAASVAGNDQRFVVTTGTAQTSVTVNFGHTWTTAPVCIVSSNSTASVVDITTTTTTAITFGASVALTGGLLNALCFGG